MINVLHIGLSPTFGGIESFLLNLQKNHDEAIFNYEFVSYSSNAAGAAELKELGAKVHSLSNRSNPIMYIKDLSSIISHGYDVVHLHKNSAMDVIPLMVAKRYNVPQIIVHSHNGSHALKRYQAVLHRLGRQFIAATATAMIACSRSAADWLFPLGVKVDIVNNGVNCDLLAFDPILRKEIRSQLGLENALVIGSIGRVTSQKNQPFMLDVLVWLIQNKIDAKLLIVGDGPEMETLKARVEEDGLDKDVVFAGFQKKTATFLAAMDVFLMPSFYEGFPIAAIEAQANGLPVLCSDRVSKEVALTKETHFIDIDSSCAVEKWGNAIISLGKRDENVIQSHSFRDHDWKEVANKVERIYLRDMKGHIC